MLVNVPVAAAPVVVAQTVDPSAPVPMGIVVAEPTAPTAPSMVQPMVMERKGVAPVNDTMKRGPMDDRMREVSSGCYYQQNCPCCFIGYLSFNEDRSTYWIGPCCGCCCPCPCPPGCCGTLKAASPGSSVYNGDVGEDVWQSSTKFIRNSNKEKDHPYVKC